MIKYVTLDIRLECDKCGEALDGSFDNYKSVLKVEPCYNCGLEEYGKGHTDGFEEGFSEGAESGYEDGRYDRA